METVADIFAALGGTSAVARLLGVNQSTASEMKRRGSIPNEYWVLLVSRASEHGVVNVTYEVLALIHAKAKGKLPEQFDHAEAAQ